MEITKFWSETLAELDKVPLNLQMKELKDVALPNGQVFEISLQSLYLETIHGLFYLPTGPGPHPVVIDIMGYMVHIQAPTDFSHWLTCGCACLVIDNRDQGGKTGDTVSYETTQSDIPMCRGLLEPHDFYMRRLVADQVRLVTLAKSLPQVDREKIIIHGNSQGGGVGIMVSALCAPDILATLVNVPSHSNIPHRISEGTGSYGAIKDYLRQHPDNQAAVLNTLHYFDTENLATWLHGPIYTSVGSSDHTCPMADFFGTYHQLAEPKALTVFWGHGHEGGSAKRLHQEMKLVKELI